MTTIAELFSNAKPAKAEHHGAPAHVLTRFLKTMPIYFVLCAWLLASVHVGLLAAAPTLAVVIYCIVGQLALYAWLRRRPASSSPGSHPTFANVVFALGLLLLGLSLIPPIRSVGLQLLLLIVAFDLARTTGRQLLVVIVLGEIGFIIMVVVECTTNGSSPDLKWHLLRVVMAALLLPSLLGVGGLLRSTRNRRRQQTAELAEVLKKLEVLSERDALTGAFNRRHGTILLEQERARQSRTDVPFCIAMLDIDFFKRINDTYGHACGDAVLIGLVRLLHEGLAVSQPVVRWGGEEFVVLLPGTELASAGALMNVMRAKVNDHDWSDCAAGLRVDMSIGVCQHRDCMVVTETLEGADAALYEAKRMGRGRVVEHRR